jgi:hypothetical protein
VDETSYLDFVFTASDTGLKSVHDHWEAIPSCSDMLCQRIAQRTNPRQCDQTRLRVRADAASAAPMRPFLSNQSYLAPDWASDLDMVGSHSTFAVSICRRVCALLQSDFPPGIGSHLHWRRHPVKSPSGTFMLASGRRAGSHMLVQVPSSCISMALRPTPIHKWPLPGVPDSVDLFIKRDDLSGMEMSGNKVG